MPNIRKKQNHCLHMSRDCPPLVSLLRPVIANLCKTIPVAKEEGALERNILVRKQHQRRAVLGQAFYRSPPPAPSRRRSLTDARVNAATPVSQHTQNHSVDTAGPGLQLFRLSSRGYGSHFERVDGQSHKNRSQANSSPL